MRFQLTPLIIFARLRISARAALKWRLHTVAVMARRRLRRCRCVMPSYSGASLPERALMEALCASNGLPPEQLFFAGGALFFMLAMICQPFMFYSAVAAAQDARCRVRCAAAEPRHCAIFRTPDTPRDTPLYATPILPLHKVTLISPRFRRCCRAFRRYYYAMLLTPPASFSPDEDDDMALLNNPGILLILTY